MLRSGFSLKDSVGFAERIELMMKASLNLDPHEMPEEEPEDQAPEEIGKEQEDADDDESTSSDKKKRVEEEHVEL